MHFCLCMICFQRKDSGSVVLDFLHVKQRESFPFLIGTASCVKTLSCGINSCARKILRQAVCLASALELIGMSCCLSLVFAVASDGFSDIFTAFSKRFKILI